MNPTMKHVLLPSLAFAALLALLPACSRDNAEAPAVQTDPNRTPDGIRIHGAELAQWTHDWDAAIELGRAEKRPVLAMFTASDWNSWHKFVAKTIFNTPVWKEWLGKKLVLVWINHPNNAALVPEEYVERNRTLTRQYGASAFPALLLINASTRQAYDRYHVTRESSPAEFIAWINRTYAENQPGGVKAHLSEEDRAALEELRAKREPLKKAYEDAVAEANREYDALKARKASLSTEELSAWAKASDEKLAALKAPVDALDRELDAFYAKVADSLLAQ